MPAFSRGSSSSARTAASAASRALPPCRRTRHPASAERSQAAWRGVSSPGGGVPQPPWTTRTGFMRPVSHRLRDDRNCRRPLARPAGSRGSLGRQAGGPWMLRTVLVLLLAGAALAGPFCLDRGPRRRDPARHHRRGQSAAGGARPLRGVGGGHVGRRPGPAVGERGAEGELRGHPRGARAARARPGGVRSSRGARPAGKGRPPRGGRGRRPPSRVSREPPASSSRAGTRRASWTCWPTRSSSPR